MEIPKVEVSNPPDIIHKILMLLVATGAGEERRTTKEEAEIINI